MSKVIDCECGQQIRAESEDELLTRVEQHVSTDHPELAGKLSREDVLAMSHET